MKLEKDQLDNEFINLEVERIKLLFEKNKYDKEQKKWFIEAKMLDAKNNKDINYIKVCDILLKELI